MKQFVHTACARVLVIAKNPVLRPVEIWALRALFAVVAAWLGFDIKGAV